MSPTLNSGDVVIAWRWFKPRPGQVVVLQAARLLIKRLRAVQGGRLWVEGDNAAASRDSRHYGVVSAQQLTAKVVFRIGFRT